MIKYRAYDPDCHGGGAREVLAKNGWEERYIAGQLAALDVFSGDPPPGTRGKVYVAESEGLLSGFVCVELREWNRLGQLHGLAVDPDLKRRGIASALVRHAERFVREEGGRGIYVDTPATNEGARGFYRALGYRHAYTMPEYYDEGLVRRYLSQALPEVRAALAILVRNREPECHADSSRTIDKVCRGKGPPRFMPVSAR